MLLHYEPVPGFGFKFRRRLGRLLELALAFVFFQGHGETPFNHRETPLGFARGRHVTEKLNPRILREMPFAKLKNS